MSQWSLSDSKSSHFYRTLLSFLVDLNNSVVSKLSNLSSISSTFCLISKPLGTVPSASVTTGVTVTLMFLIFFSSLASSKYLSIFSLFLIYSLFSLSRPTRWQNPLDESSFFFLVNNLCLVFWPVLDNQFVSQNSAYICGCRCSVMVKPWIVVSEFKLPSSYYVHFRTNPFSKSKNPLILPTMSWIIPLLFFSQALVLNNPQRLKINFYLLKTFVLILVVFFLRVCVVSSFTTFWPNFTSSLLQVIYRDLG